MTYRVVTESWGMIDLDHVLAYLPTLEAAKAYVEAEVSRYFAMVEGGCEDEYEGAMDPDGSGRTLAVLPPEGGVWFYDGEWTFPAGE